MSFINEENEQELNNFFTAIDSIAQNDQSLVDVIATDEVLKELIDKESKRMSFFLDLYNQNAHHLERLYALPTFESEIEFCKDKITMIERDLRTSYSLYKTYKKVAESRDLEVMLNPDFSDTENVLLKNGLIQKEKQL